MTRVRCVRASCRAARARLTPRALRASVAPSDRMGKQCNDNVRTNGAFLLTLEWGHLATARCNSSENCSSFGLSCASPPPLRVGGFCVRLSWAYAFLNTTSSRTIVVKVRRWRSYVYNAWLYLCSDVWGARVVCPRVRTARGRAGDGGARGTVRRAVRVSARASVRLRVCPRVSVSRWSRRDETRGDDVRCVAARRRLSVGTV